jgi:hypothetical protein
MSFGASAVAWHHSKATGTDLLVLMAIANYISDDGAWPKVETIAQDARTSVRQAHRSINSLKALGEIDWVQKAGKGRGVYKSNLYVFLLKCPPECQGDWNHTCQDVTSRPDNLSPLDMTHTADKPITQPVIEKVTYMKKEQTKNELEFEIFWKQYPRKEGKPKANREYLKLANELGTDYLMQQLLIWLSHPSKKDRTYWPHAERWLRDRRFDDELPSASGMDKSKILGWFE